MENLEQFAKVLPIKIYIIKPDIKLQVDYNYLEKFTGQNMHDVNLEILHPVKQKLDLPDPNGPLSQIVLPMAIAAANIKFAKALNEA